MIYAHAPGTEIGHRAGHHPAIVGSDTDLHTVLRDPLNPAAIQHAVLGVLENQGPGEVENRLNRARPICGRQPLGMFKAQILQVKVTNRVSLRSFHPD